MDDKNATGAVPGDINEEYYQISAEIMEGSGVSA